MNPELGAPRIRPMSKAPPMPRGCDFCPGDGDGVMFKSERGGFPARICGECILKFAGEIVARAEQFAGAADD